MNAYLIALQPLHSCASALGGRSSLHIAASPITPHFSKVISRWDMPSKCRTGAGRSYGHTGHTAQRSGSPPSSCLSVGERGHRKPGFGRDHLQ